MTAPSSFKFSMKCGTAGAWTEVTDDVLFDEGNIPYQWGRTSGFDQATRPGLYSVTLKNPTGIYSPDNPLSTLATPLVEGMGVNWELNGVQRAGTIRSVQPIFADGGVVATAGRVRVTVDDMIGNAARHSLASDLGTSIYQSNGGLLRWRLDDAAGSTVLVEASGGVALGVAGDFVCGSAGSHIPSSPVVLATMGTGSGIGSSGVFPVWRSGTTSLGNIGYWTERTGTITGYPQVSVSFGDGTIQYSLAENTGSFVLTVSGGTVTGPAFDIDRPHFVEVVSATTFAAGVWTATFTLYVDGVSYGSAASLTTPATLAPADRTIRSFFITSSGSAGGQFYMGPISYSTGIIDESNTKATTAQLRLSAIAATTPEITLDTVPSMSPAILGTQGGNTTAAAMDEVLRGEQGGMNVITTGSLLAPVPKIVTYARDRKRAVDLTVSMNQIQDKPQFVRALTNTVAYATASGPTQSVTYFDPTMPALVGSADTSDQVTLRDHDDLYASASDRLYRGKNVATPILSFQIDARSLDINLWTQLMALRPGHRVHITDCLQLNLGYATWDGWVVGGDELHTGETRSLFTIYVQPAWDAPVYGTARYAAGAGVMTLQSNISAGATSLGIVSTGDLFTTNGAHFPQNISIGSGPKAEIVTLSAVSGASSPQTGTISARGVGIVPATAWTAGAAIDVSPLWRYDY